MRADALEAAGLVELVAERRKGNMTERVLRATADAFVISPQAWAFVAADPDRAPDTLSIQWLLALAARLLREVGRLVTGARGRRVATFAIDGEITFAAAADRAAFPRGRRRDVRDPPRDRPACHSGGGVARDRDPGGSGRLVHDLRGRSRGLRRGRRRGAPAPAHAALRYPGDRVRRGGGERRHRGAAVRPQRNPRGGLGDEWETTTSVGWDLYLFTLGQYLRHFPGRPAVYAEAVGHHETGPADRQALTSTWTTWLEAMK